MVMLTLAVLPLAGRTVTLDRADAVYKCGENAVFTVQPFPGAAGKFKGILSLDGGKVLRTVEFDAAGGYRISGTLKNPGVLQLRVTGLAGGRKVELLSAAAFEPFKILPGTEAPADLADFWRQEKAKAEKFPMDLKVTRLEKFCNSRYSSYEVSLALPDGRIYGFLCIPKSSKPLPALIGIEPSGIGRNTPVVNQFGNRFAVLWMNVHNFSPTMEPAARNKAWKALNKPVFFARINSHDRYKQYYHRVLTGLCRAVDYLASRPEIDGSRIGAFGVSQGGGLALMLAALHPRIKAVCANVPALCDHHAFTQGRRPGWPRMVDPKNKATAVCASYYDAALLASQIKVPCWIIGGMIDTTCPPGSVCAAFNRVQSKEKYLILEPGMGHASRPSYGKALGSMRKYIEKSVPPRNKEKKL